MFVINGRARVLEKWCNCLTGQQLASTYMARASYVAWDVGWISMRKSKNFPCVFLIFKRSGDLDRQIVDRDAKLLRGIRPWGG